MTDQPTPAGTLRAAAERARQIDYPLHIAVARWLDSAAYDAVQIGASPQALAVAQELLGTTTPHACDNCDGVDPGTCVMNDGRTKAHEEGERSFCGNECNEPNDDLPVYDWAEAVYRTDGTRTVHIPWLGADGREAGSIRVNHKGVRTLALMLCDDITRIPGLLTEHETDEERADRLEVESEHAAGIHTHCGVTCEEEFPSLMLRNTILVRAIPGSATMLDELVRRAARPSESQ